ncbi:hypothetical protein EMIT0158MI4_20304 [Burkholderia ambifaria]
MTKLFRQFDSVAPRRDGELIRRDMPGRAGTSRGAPGRLPRSGRVRSSGPAGPTAGT